MAHGIVGQRDIDQAKTHRESALSDFNRAKDRLRLLGMDPDKTELGARLIVRSRCRGRSLMFRRLPENSATTLMLHL